MRLRTAYAGVLIGFVRSFQKVFGTNVSPSLSTFIRRLATMVETGMREIYSGRVNY